MKKAFTLILMSFIFQSTWSQIKSNIDWPSFMAQHDLVWEDIPLQWAEGAFVGNGQLGMMLYAKMDENRFNFHVGRQDVTDHRQAPDKKTSMGEKGTNLMDFSRLDIGKMTLHPAGKIKTAHIRQDLYSAEIRGTIITDLGEIEFRAFTPYDKMVQVIEATSTEKKNGKYVPFTWKWMPGEASSPRAFTKYEQYKDSYKFNPYKPEISKHGEAFVCEQKLEAGGDYATAWIDVKSEKAQKSTIYIATANEIPASGVSASVALKAIREAKNIGANRLEKNHRAWWHAYFQKSFLNVPDTRMESFYWIQLYKMAACSRADGPALDLMGPFFKNTGWPGLWWNLNVQLTYWPFNTSNHQDIAVNYIRLIDDHFDWIMESKAGKSLGDYAWALHNYWLYYNYQGDEQAILEKWVPKAMRIAEVYETKLEPNAAGVLELTAMGSPEYMGFKSFKNTNYNLAILRWLLSELIDTNEKANQNQAKVKHWKQVLADLIPYPTDENGLMIGSDQPVHISHRHYSHLLALYPLFQLDPNSPEDRDLVVESVLHWHNIEDGKALAGYSYTGASSLYAALGMGDEAVAVMQDFLDGNIGKAHFLTNTFYMEGNSPVIETPLSAAAAIMEYNLQSWGDKIRIFPAIPSHWENASFADLLAQGGFLVSASLKEKKVDWVSIESQAGQPCSIKVPSWNQAVQISKGRKVSITKTADGEFSIDLKKGEKVVLSSRIQESKPILNLISHPDNEINYFGVKKGAERKPLLEYPILEYKE
ncbi:glycosyl hydrolase family 95 catalytic domain-containing protein [Formosa sp. PL04]|uniref:glycosyl hydrolase family 95 catalytic domain-containing protein n=1 Tax=Formosa sp. PL04 TaxID=3081755 RepID=UPI002982AE85|nr:hypothetical protein [Formosa sp. PL04]MDW5290190.1 hypothetical protein [Formosa sp. PL04]